MRIRLQRHHLNGFENAHLGRDGLTGLGATVSEIVNLNRNDGHFNSRDEELRFSRMVTRAMLAVIDGEAEIIPDGQPDIICWACRKRECLISMEARRRV